MAKQPISAPLKRAKRRRYPLHRIKRGQCYDTAEIAVLFGLHSNTVRHWLKDGLPTIDRSRPFLVHGSALKSYLAEKQTSKTKTCALDEFFCFRCRMPRKPWGGLVDFRATTDKIAHATALCVSCETTMRRAFRSTDIPKVESLLRILQLPPERLSDCPPVSGNRDFKRSAENA